MLPNDSPSEKDILTMINELRDDHQFIERLHNADSDAEFISVLSEKEININEAELDQAKDISTEIVIPDKEGELTEEDLELVTGGGLALSTALIMFGVLVVICYILWRIAKNNYKKA